MRSFQPHDWRSLPDASGEGFARKRPYSFWWGFSPLPDASGRVDTALREGLVRKRP